LSFVLDSSVSLAWCFEDERLAATTMLLHRVAETGATAPQHWPLEAQNALIVAERRKRLHVPRRRLADFLRDLPILLDTETTAHISTATQGLPERVRLTAYDAAYLELARRKSQSLDHWTRTFALPARSLA
jgi:predicted nucleic acid-binding protein